jgi:hypothetical protein
MGKISLAMEIAKFVLFIIRSLKDLVVQAEEMMPEPGRGSEKFAAVKEALITAARYAGMADEAVDRADAFIDEKINKEVQVQINEKK